MNQKYMIPSDNSPLRDHGNADANAHTYREHARQSDDETRPILRDEDFGGWKTPPPETESEWRFIQSIIVCFFAAVVLGAVIIGAAWAVWGCFRK